MTKKTASKAKTARRPEIGRRVVITWADIEANANARPASLKLPVCQSEGVLTEWNTRDPSGLRRCVLRNGLFLDEPDLLGDYLILPQGVIIEWSYL